MTTTQNTPTVPTPATAPTPAPAVPAAPAPSGWVPAALTAIGIVVTLTACGFGAFLVYAYPAVREPLGTAIGIATVLGMVTALIISLRRR